jgi:hypothetical protein
MSVAGLKRVAGKFSPEYGPDDWYSAACGARDVIWCRYDLVLTIKTGFGDPVSPPTVGSPPTCPKCAVLLDQALEVAP